MDDHTLSFIELTEQVLGERLRLQVPDEELGKTMRAVLNTNEMNYKPQRILASSVAGFV